MHPVKSRKGSAPTHARLRTPVHLWSKADVQSNVTPLSLSKTVFPRQNFWTKCVIDLVVCGQIHDPNGQSEIGHFRRSRNCRNVTHFECSWKYAHSRVHVAPVFTSCRTTILSKENSGSIVNTQPERTYLVLSRS